MIGKTETAGREHLGPRAEPMPHAGACQTTFRLPGEREATESPEKRMHCILPCLVIVRAMYLPGFDYQVKEN